MECYSSDDDRDYRSLRRICQVLDHSFKHGGSCAFWCCLFDPQRWKRDWRDVRLHAALRPTCLDLTGIIRLLFFSWTGSMTKTNRACCQLLCKYDALRCVWLPFPTRKYKIRYMSILVRLIYNCKHTPTIWRLQYAFISPWIVARVWWWEDTVDTVCGALEVCLEVCGFLGDMVRSLLTGQEKNKSAMDIKMDVTTACMYGHIYTNNVCTRQKN